MPVTVDRDKCIGIKFIRELGTGFVVFNGAVGRVPMIILVPRVDDLWAAFLQQGPLFSGDVIGELMFAVAVVIYLSRVDDAAFVGEDAMSGVQRDRPAFERLVRR